MCVCILYRGVIKHVVKIISSEERDSGKVMNLEYSHTVVCGRCESETHFHAFGYGCKPGLGRVRLETFYTGSTCAVPEG